MYAAGLIHKEDLPPEASSVKIKSDLYLVLIRVSYTGYKS
jgi:hypothetical protein